MRSLALPLVLVLLAPTAFASVPLELAPGAPGTRESAQPIGEGEYRGEFLSPAGRDDWYRVSVPAATRLVVAFSSTDGAILEIYPEGSASPSASTGPVYADVGLVDALGPGSFDLRARGRVVGVLPYSFTVRFASLHPVEADPVVVATFDTGTNPWHPCFRRPGLTDPRALVPAYPASSRPLALTFLGDYASSKAASETALAGVQDWTLYHVQNTSLITYGGTSHRTAFIDDYPHGAQASSQIGCAEYGLAPNALLVILNWYDVNDEGDELIRWAADQPWIDVIHLNIQDVPLVAVDAPEVNYAIASGKLVVVAAGNGVAGEGPNYPMELSKWTGPAGSLVAGSMANGGYTYYSNLGPHVAADGDGTLAAAPSGFGTTTFGGTSSASPRITGYTARILGELRNDLGHTGANLLTIPADRPRPSTGPLVDGVLTAAELHEVIRKTADPNPHDSRYDGGSTRARVPAPVHTPFAFYPKIGYGEVSELTLPTAARVASGVEPMPVRAVEDHLYGASETLRSTYWG